MPVDAHSRQGAPSLMATRYGGPITIRAKEGMPKANLKARRTQPSPLYQDAKDMSRCQGYVKNETYNKNKIVHTRESGTRIPKGASACARDLINPTFMTLNVSFRVSKEQDTTSKKCMHRYALDGR